MRTRLVILVLATLVAAGCGAAPGATSKGGAGATVKPAGGQVDCASVTAATAQLLAVQLLAQLTTPDAIEAIKTKQIGNLDLDKFLAAMGDLHALDGQTSVLGDPKAAIDVYQKAAKAAKVLFATEPVTQAAIDTYNSNVGTVADFIGHQAAIAGAIDAAGC